MSSTSDRKVSLGRSRPTPSRLQDLASTPESPRTPLQRSTSSFYGSPGGSFRTEEEYIVLELGSRFLRGGFPGESAPRCTLSFGPEEQRRVGDYRQWDPDYTHKRRKRKRGQEWGHEYELYRMDLTSLDLGLVEDKFERAIRDAYNKYLLLDPKPRRVLLALPPLMPRQLLSTVLSVLFGNFQAPSITLMSSPILATVAAALRSALVVDIGWAETTVTGVCEYREVHQRKSIRAGKYLSEEMANMLTVELDKAAQPNTPAVEVTFEDAEEVLSRIGWCKTQTAAPFSSAVSDDMTSDEEHFVDASDQTDDVMLVPFLSLTPPRTLSLPASRLSTPAETAFFATGTPLSDIDDHELPLHHLIYRALLSLPIDIRKVCMSRIVITGGPSNLAGLKTRILNELDALVQRRGWDPVKSYGSATDRHERILRQKRRNLKMHDSEAPKGMEPVDPDTPTSSLLSAGLVSPEADPITAKLEYQALQAGPPAACMMGGIVRGVETLGAWVGASLVAQLRIRGIVEIEREKFLQHGLQGAAREKEISVVPQRQSMGPGMRPGAGDRGSWTLGVWA